MVLFFPLFPFWCHDGLAGVVHLCLVLGLFGVIACLLMARFSGDNLTFYLPEAEDQYNSLEAEEHQHTPEPRAMCVSTARQFSVLRYPAGAASQPVFRGGAGLGSVRPARARHRRQHALVAQLP
jgi:hypothetical protein